MNDVKRTNTQFPWWPGVPVAVVLGVTTALATGRVFGPEISRYCAIFVTTAVVGWLMAVSGNVAWRGRRTPARVLSSLLCGALALLSLGLLEMLLPF